MELRSRLDHIYHGLCQVEDPSVGITLEGLRSILTAKHPWLVDRLFARLKKEWNIANLRAEDVHLIFLHILGQEPDTKTFFLFSLFDESGGGKLTCTDLKQVLSDCMQDNGVAFEEEEQRQMVKVLIQECLGVKGVDKVCYSGVTIEYKDILNLLSHESDLAPTIALSLDLWLAPLIATKSRLRIQNIIPKNFVGNNLQHIAFVIALIVAVVLLFIIRGAQFHDAKNIDGTTSWIIIIARGCGVCINFLVSLLTLLMCRWLTTLLRKHHWTEYLPIDHHVSYHKLMGGLVFIFGIIHTKMHLMNLVLNLKADLQAVISLNSLQRPTNMQYNFTYSEWLFTAKPGLFGFFPGWAFPTGMALLFVSILMGVGVVPAIRRRGHFEIFYFTHLGYLLFWLLLCLHCPSFWQWFIMPSLLFFAGKVRMIYNWFNGDGKTYVVAGALLPSKVTQLVIRRNPDFHFRPGDWVFVNIPIISKFEWHPFTISSAPEEKDVLTLHIRSLGGWTKTLHQYFLDENEAIENEKLGIFVNTPNTSQSMARAIKSVYRGAEVSPKIESEDQATAEPITKDPIIADPATEEVEESYSYYKIEDDRFDVSQKSKELSDAFSLVFNPNNILQKDYEDSQSFLLRPARKILLAEGEIAENQVGYHDIHSRSHITSRPKTTHSRARKPLCLYMNGPNGAPASSIFNAEHAILVATGIGVTPFASILQSIMFKYWESQNVCPRCNHQWSDGKTPKKSFKLNKVDFIWINREQKSFEWFLQLLAQLEMEQAQHFGKNADQFVDVHLYITSVLPVTDVKAITLHLALDLMHKQTKRDLISGLKTRTKAGRPNWDDLFRKAEKANYGKVSVFYCGNPLLAKTLATKCNEFKFDFKKEIF
ncbi:NADPH oxidase 5-like isoform X2 [Tigriopus californicus]|nr:NADPH oxidase 5-like isoform X2 [Tigriopus californicus]